MKWFKRAKGGRIPKTKPQGIPIQLAPGEVHCVEPECRWFKVGGTEQERVQALQTHFVKCHRASYL